MDLADAIIDFRDEDNEKGRNGAERRDYDSAGLSYGPKNEPFQLVDELVYVLGMTPNIYRRVAPLLTVRGQEERPHLYTAPLEVRAAMIAAQASRTRTGRAGGRGRGRISRDQTESAGMTEGALGDLGGSDAAADPGSWVDPVCRYSRSTPKAGIASGAVFAREATVDLAGVRIYRSSFERGGERIGYCSRCRRPRRPSLPDQARTVDAGVNCSVDSSNGDRAEPSGRGL